MAMPSRCFIPKEKCPAFFLPVFESPTSSKSSGMPPSSGSPSTRYCSLRFCSAVMSGYREGVSTTAPMRRRARFSRGSPSVAPYRE